MVESAGALGQPPAPSRRRGELFPQRGPPGKGAMASRSAGMKCGFGSRFWPAAGEATSEGKAGVPGMAGLGGFRSPEPGGDLSEVPAVSTNYLAGVSAARERPILLRSICFFIASAPFLTLQSLLWLVSEMPRRVLTLRGGRGEESRHPPIPLHTPPKKKKSPQCSSPGSLQILRHPVFTDLNDLGERIGLLSASWWLFCPSRSKYSLWTSLPSRGIFFEKWGLSRVFRLTNCCGSGLRIWTSDGAGKNSDHLEDLATLDEGRVFPFGKSAVCSRLLSVTVCAVLVAFVWLKSITPIENSSLVRNNCFAQTFPPGAD